MKAALPLRPFRAAKPALVALSALCWLFAARLAVAASMCAPVGGAPGPWPNFPDSPFGSIGSDASPVPGLSPDEWITDLVGGGSAAPPREPCVPGGEQAGGSSEPASLPSQGPGRGAGNPVDLVTGNKYAHAVDLLAPDPESGLAAALVEALGADAAHALGPAWQAFAPLRLVFSRHYNSRFDAAGPLGPGWRHGFETALARLRARDGVELQVVQADGRRIVFRPVEAGASHFDGAEPGTGRIHEQFAGSLPWAWHWPDGRVLRFDREGRLSRIEAPDRDRLVLERNPNGRLAAIEDGNGRRLGLEYEDDRLAALVLPDGQRIRYRYDAHRVLSEVVYPDGRALRYRYEDLQAFHLLTRIERPGRAPTRYRYDEQRRVIESSPGVDGAPPLRLAWFPPGRMGETGRTQVDEGERRSTWRWRIDPGTGAAELLSVEGQPCTGCPAIAPSATVAAASSASSMSALSAVPLDAGAARPGIERRLQTDAFGLPAEALLVDLADPERVIHLRWRRHETGPLAGKLAWVERLAPDGRAARTVLRHDPRRRLVAIESPEGLIEWVDRDASGRPVAWRLAGPGQREAGFDAHGRLVSWRVDGRSTLIAWGPNGLPASVDWPAGDRWRFQWAEGSVVIRSDRGWVAGGVAKAVGAGATRVASSVDRGMVVAIAGHGVAAGSAVSSANDRGLAYVVDAAGRRTDFLRDAFGRLIEERSSQAGWRRFSHDAWGRVARVESSDGSTEHRIHDLAGRLLERVQARDDARLITRFAWRGRALVGIEHPEQSTFIEHDPNGQVSSIVDRIGGVDHRWTFARDARGRVVGQDLPDGSLVSYRHDPQGRPVAMHWQASAAAPALIIVDEARYVGNVPVGWRYGNGTRFERSDDPMGRPLAWRWLGGSRSDADQLPDWRYRWHANGLPAGIDLAGERRRFGWVLLGRLIIDEREAGALRTAEYFAWDATGSLVAAGGAGPGRASTQPLDAGGRNAMGQVSTYRGMRLERGVTGRIERVIAPADGEQSEIARYAYNAAGERIRSEPGPGSRASAGRESARGFLYRGRRLAAETDGAGRLSRHYLRWMGAPVAIIDRGNRPAAGRAGNSPEMTRVAWLHGDHLGTPHAATDSRGRLVWEGRYRAFGRLAGQRGSLRQPLRFDGQYEDPETGLHDNYQRSYDPDSGRYLEPDPMGLVAGFDRHAYADGNPVLATDPLGLILFAFDGTRNAADPPGRDDVSNVRKFFDLYSDEDKWYMTGVGLADPDSKIGSNALDAINANTARARVDYMLTELDRYVGTGDRTGDTIDIDVVGFSRGAAMARDFVNHVATRDAGGRWRDHGVCINLRFLGLWDTVAQFGANGIDNASWRLAIPASVGVTYHAVALNEHRTLFPLESAHGMAVIERGFIGSHADIGGGNAEGDLSDISLVWMFEKARTAGLPLWDLPAAFTRVESPFLHDRNFDLVGDRQVISRDSTGKVVSSVPQRRARIAGMSWSATQPFLAVAPWRQKDADGKVSIIGDVDIDAYLDWLELHYGLAMGAG